MIPLSSRRSFVKQVAGLGAGVAGLGAFRPGQGVGAAEFVPAPAPAHTLTKISGTPRERGRQYGRTFKDKIHEFHDREIVKALKTAKTSYEGMLRYARDCGKEARGFSPILWDELEGMSEGTGLRIEDVLLITLHEELYHRGVLPSVDHCTVGAAGPPDTKDGHSYIGQTWDWMARLYGVSNMLHWERPEGPSILSYAYPGLWVAAGLNSAGIGFCWTSAWDPGKKIAGPKIGVPTYVLLTHLLYQETLDAVAEEARRATQAGWFTFVFADSEGRIVNVEGSPKDLVIERAHGHMVRQNYGTRRLTGTPEGEPLPPNAKRQRLETLLAPGSGQLDRHALQEALSDHKAPICAHGGTIDTMLFDMTAKEAYITRGPTCSNRWKTFTFKDA